jgi:hypothetical protein
MKKGKSSEGQLIRKSGVMAIVMEAGTILFLAT